MKLVPKNWTIFQHYKDRCPPWVKLHRELLNDKQFMCLPVASKALAPLLWLLASESNDGSFNASVEELMFRGYLMQGFGLAFKNGIAPLIITSVLFGLMHASNPEAKVHGLAIMMPYYMFFGAFLAKTFPFFITIVSSEKDKASVLSCVAIMQVICFSFKYRNKFLRSAFLRKVSI